MPDYFFYVRTAHGTLINDDEGVRLPDIEVALDEASRAAKGLSEDAAMNGYDASGCYFEIISSDGRVRIVVPISSPTKSSEADGGCKPTQPLRFLRSLYSRLVENGWRGVADLKGATTHA